MEKTRNAYRILVWKPQGREQFGDRRWESNARKDPEDA
jgi:hypothetical protein